MEPWQESFIRKNLLELVDLTKLNKTLEIILSEDKLFDDDDLKQLKLAKENEGGIAATKLLFDILISRKNSYKAIGKATFESRQSGAFLLLLKGLVQYLLQQCNINLNEQALVRNLKAECFTDDAWKFFNAKISKSSIYEENWIPPAHPFYIPRLISNRIKLNPEIFKQKCSDVFIFTGMSRSKLSQLAEPNRSAESREVIIDNMTTARFIHLEYMEDWDKLKSKWPTQPTHLIQYDSYSLDFILLCSTQPSQHVLKHLPPHLREKSLYVSEEGFITCHNNEKHRSIVCICDSPGMGKTWLLENLARQANQPGSNRIIAVIRLQQFVQETLVSTGKFTNDHFEARKYLLRYLCPFRLTSVILESALENNEIQLELFLDGFDEIPKEDVESTKCFFESIAKTQNNVSFFITSRPHLRSELEKMFAARAYDILPFSEENQIDFLVKYWQNATQQSFTSDHKKLKLFARACLQKTRITQLEADIMGIPLQCYLLASVNLENAEMFCRDDSDDPSRYIRSTSMYDAYKINMEIGMKRAVGKYHLFKYDTVVKEVGKEKYENSTSDKEGGKHLKAFHTWKALELLFPHLSEEYFQTENLTDRKPSEQVLACGLLQTCTTNEETPSSATFLHRTFAEHLVAEHFAEVFSGCHGLGSDGLMNKYLSVFVQQILAVQKANIEHPCEQVINNDDDDDDTDELTDRDVNHTCVDGNTDNDTDTDLSVVTKFQRFEFTNSALVYFLNAGLHLNKFKFISKDISQALRGLLLEENVYKILSACLSSNYANIIRLLNNTLEPTTPKNSTYMEYLQNRLIYPAKIQKRILGFAPDKQYLSHLAYLSHAAITSNIKVTKELYSLFENCVHVNLNNICSTLPLNLVTPLHFAVARLDFSLVEFFRHVTVSGRRILYMCMDKRYRKSPKQYENLLEICKLLLKQDNTIISEKIKMDNQKIGSIVSAVADLKCIKFFVERGADIKTTFLQNNNIHTILTRNALYMDKNMFSELCQYLINDIKEHDLFKSNLPYWDDPLLKVIGKIDHTVLRCLLGIPGIELHGIDDRGNNLPHLAIIGDGDTNVIQHLVDQGVNLFGKNYKGETLLHLAARKGNIDIVKYLMSHGLTINVKDNFDNTPLHAAARNLEMIKYLVSKSDNTLEVNMNKNNIAHLMLSELIPMPDLKNNLINSYIFKASDLANNVVKKNRTELYENFGMANTTSVHNRIEIMLCASREIVKASNMYDFFIFLTTKKRWDSLDCLKSLKKFGACYTVTTILGGNAFNIAAVNVCLEAIQHITSIGLSLKLKDHKRVTPLQIAVYSPWLDMVKDRIREYVKFLAEEKNAHLMLHIIEQYPGLDGTSILDSNIEYLLSLPEAPQLLKMTNQDQRTPLHEWILSNNAPPDRETIQRILKISGEDVNAPDSLGNTMFLTAAGKQDSLAVLKCLKEFGADYNATNVLGRNALHTSATYGVLESVEYLVSIGVSREHQDNNGCTPLLLAAYFQNIDVLKYLIGQDFNIFAVDNKGNNCAHHVVMKKYDDTSCLKQCMEFLISLEQAPQLFKMSNNYKKTPLHTWILSNIEPTDRETIKRILKISEEDVNAPDNNGNTMFLTAARKYNCLAILHCLKEFGANYNATNNFGSNALHHSASLGIVEWVEYLVSVGVSREHQDNNGRTPLLIAANFHKIDVLKYLIEENANIFAVDNYGNNFVHHLVTNTSGDASAVKQSIEYSISLPEAQKLFKMTNQCQRTPLYEGIKSNNIQLDCEVIQRILKISGEDVNAADSGGNTIFIAAAKKHDSLAVLKCLKSCGAKYYEVDKLGRSALHISAGRGIVTMAQYFVSIGISLEIQDKDGCTPLLLAAYFHKIDVLKYFIQQDANIFAIDKLGNNCVHLLVKEKCGDISILKKGIEYLISLEQAPQLFKLSNNNKQTPLHTWILSNNEPPDNETIQLIQKISGEDVNARDTNGYNMFLTAASKQDSLAVLKCLKDLGSDYNATKKNGTNALHFSAACGNLENAQYFVSIGVSLECQSNTGVTPLLLAACFHKIDLLKYFIEQHANVLAVDHRGNNCVHQLLFEKWGDTSALNQGIEYLISLPQARQLFKMANIIGRTPLHVWFASENILPDPETTELILETSEENANSIDMFEKTLFLAAAAKKDSLACLKCLMKYGASPNSTDKNGVNALHALSVFGCQESAKNLVSLGISLENMDKSGFTPLLIAAHHRNVDILKYLISVDANIQAENIDGHNIAHLLLLSTQNDKSARLQVLGYLFSLAEGAELFKSKNKWDRTPLHECMALNNVLPDREILELILQKTDLDVNATDIFGNTMFLTAAEKKDSLPTLKYFKGIGANHHLVNRSGLNALHISGINGLLASAEYFVSMGVSLEQKDNNGNTPCLLAAYFRQIEMVKYFIRKQANILAVNDESENVAHILLSSKYDDKTTVKDIVEYLFSLKQGAELFKMRNKDGRTPLHAWVASEVTLPDPETMELILQSAQLNLNDTDDYGNTMFLTASSKKYAVPWLELLIKFGVDQNATNRNGTNALHYAAQHGSVKVAEYLMSIGVDLECRENSGYTPLQVAAFHNNIEMVKYIISHHAHVLTIDNSRNNIAHQLLSQKQDDETALVQIVKYLIKLKDGHTLFQMKNKWGKTPLGTWIVSDNSPPDHESIQLILQNSQRNTTNPFINMILNRRNNVFFRI